MDIYVGNLPYEVEEQQLQDAFSTHGKVDQVKIILDHYSGRSKGFAFVTMNNAEEARNAINELNGTDMEGRPMKVNQARGREERNFRGRKPR